MKVKSWFKKIFSPIDLTTGTPWKVIVLFAIPVLLSQLFQQFYTVMDAVVVGQAIPEQFAGINNTGPLSFLILQLAFGCTAGFSVSISSKFGDKNLEGTKKSFIHSTFLATMIAIILTIVSLCTIDPLLSLVGVKASNDLQTYEASRMYMIVICSGIICQVLYNLIVSVNRAIGDSVTPLIFLVISSVLNIILDIAFVNIFQTPNTKVFGVGFATILAQGLSALFCFIYTLRKYKFLRFTFKDLKLDGKECFTQLKNGLPLGFQFSVLAIGFIVLQNAIVGFDKGILIQGTEKFAHYAQDGAGCANRLNNLLMAPFIALGISMLSYSAMNYGKKDYHRLTKGFKSCAIIGLIISTVSIVIGLLLTINGAFVYIFLDPTQIYEETIYYATTYIYCVVPFSFFLALLMCARNIIQGMEKPFWPFMAGVLELATRILICLYVPLLIAEGPKSAGGYMAVCFADSMAWVVGAIVLVIPLIYYLVKLHKLELIQDQENLSKN